MKTMDYLKRRRLIFQPAVYLIVFSVLLLFFTGGCRKASTVEKITVNQNPDDWGLVTLYEVDSLWPQKPENITWGGIPGIDIDIQGNLWLINRALPLVQMYDADGKFIKAWGIKGVDIASVTDPQSDLTLSMSDPDIHQIKVDFEGNVWIAARKLGVVYKCSSDGKVLMVLGKYNEVGNDEAHFNSPGDMAITSTGDVFVTDDGNHRLVHFDRDGKFIKTWGKLGKGPGDFDTPHAIGIDSKGLIYVADRGNTRIQIFDQEGKFIDQWPNLIVPFDLWITGEDEVWVCGYGPLRSKTSANLPRTDDNIVMKFNSKGKVLLNWTFTHGEKPGQFGEIHGITLDTKGNVFLSDVQRLRIQKFAKL